MMNITMICMMLTVGAGAAEYKPDANALRASVPEKYRWDLSIIYPNDAVWEAGLTEAQARIRDLGAYKGQLKTAAGAKAALDAYFAARRVADRVAAYANYKAVEDDGQTRYQAMYQRALDLGADLRRSAGFIRQDLAGLDEASAQKLLEAPELKAYRRYIAGMRRRSRRMLPEDSERILGLAGDNLWSETDLNETPSEVEQVFKATLKDLQFPDIKDESGKSVRLNLGNYGKYRASKQRGVRQAAVAGLFGTLKKYQDILAATLGAEAKRDVFLARARGYDRSVDAYLDREDVPTAVLDNLISAVHANLAPLQRYLGLRRRLLGLKDIYIYDLYTPLVPSADADISYDAGLKHVKAALRPLGSDYVSKLTGRDMLGRRMVDVYPNKGKDSGAFSQAIWDLPPFVKLNYMDDIDDVSTTAHELGHAMHSYLNNQTQPVPDAGSSIFTAEIASTFNEMLLSRYLLDKYKGNDKMRLYLLSQLADSLRTTIYRQTLFAEFELKVHAFVEAGTPITAELLNQTYADLVKLYYGPGLSVTADDALEWAYIPHFYWKHYVFSYACGLASAVALSDRVLAGGSAARKAYLGMLTQPRQAHPVEILKAAGVDLTRPDAVAAAARLLDQTVSEMERLAAKTGLDKKG